MIYCLKSEEYPAPAQTIEELSYRDENGFKWKIARVENGFFVKYFGNSYFQEPAFECETSRGEYIRVKNTNCIFIQDTDFETFADVRNVLKTGYTDEIWEVFQEMFEERFERDSRILESEK